MFSPAKPETNPLTAPPVPRHCKERKRRGNLMPGFTRDCHGRRSRPRNDSCRCKRLPRPPSGSRNDNFRYTRLPRAALPPSQCPASMREIAVTCRCKSRNDAAVPPPAQWHTNQLPRPPSGPWQLYHYDDTPSRISRSAVTPTAKRRRDRCARRPWPGSARRESSGARSGRSE